MRKALTFICAVIALAIVAFIGVTEVQAAQPPSTTEADGICNGCHAQGELILSLPSGEKLPLRVEPAMLAESVHKQLQCTSCHMSIEGYPHPEVNAGSIREYELSQESLCSKCHFKAADDIQDSIHRQGGITEVATCTDCHGAHNIQSVDSGSFRLMSTMVCSSCHSNEELKTRNAVALDVVNLYLQDYHGKTAALLAQSGSEKVDIAVCTDCHGAHYIPKADAPDSMVAKDNLTNTCAKCHPGANERFTSAWLSHREPSINYSPVVFFVRWFYWIMIPFIVVGLLIHVAIDLKQSFAHRKGG